MSDRLKQIWGSFEGRTERRLTGRGVENIQLPPRRDLASEMMEEIPNDVREPAEAAFAALRVRLTDAARAAEKNRGRRGNGTGAVTPSQQYSASDMAPAFSYGAEDATHDLVRGLKETALRTDRVEADYGRFLASDAKGKLRGEKRRKKFLGIF